MRTMADTHDKFRETVRTLAFLAVGDRCGLLWRWLAVQMVSGQGLDGTHAVPDHYHHLVLRNCQVEVLALRKEIAMESVGTDSVCFQRQPLVVYG